MKNKLLGSLLFASVLFLSAYACEESLRIWHIDQAIFTIGGRFASPYNSEFVDSLTPTLVNLESDAFKPLHQCALVRAEEQAWVDRDQSDRIVIANKAVMDLEFIKRFPNSYMKLANGNPFISESFDNTQTPHVQIPKSGLFVLLQYAYGIKRTTKKEAPEILLDANGTTKLKAGPLLMAQLNEHRAHEIH